MIAKVRYPSKRALKHRFDFSKTDPLTKKQIPRHTSFGRSAESPQGQYLFGEPQYTPGEVNFKDPNKDTWRYRHYQQLVQGVPDPTTSPPRMNLVDIVGKETIQKIENAGRIVFHSVGDSGAKFTMAGLGNEADVIDKMIEDFNELDAGDIPSFLYHLGDVIYNFGENEYYYDEFYEPFRNYQGPIFAIPGNHDGMIFRDDTETSLQAFLNHFCDNEPRHALEPRGLTRTTMTHPGVYFTLAAPLATVIGLYSNTLEDPGIISSEGGKYPIDDKQKDFLKSELKRLNDENYSGAVILSVHHPPYTAGSIHAGSPGMRDDIDEAVKFAGFAPHAVLSGHAHNYQRYTRLTEDGHQIPYIVAGSGGHNATPLRTQNGATIRTPVTTDDVTFERYYADYGYLRIVVTAKIMRIEFHDVSSGLDSKSPMDLCTVDLQNRTLTTTSREVTFDRHRSRKR
jgi:Icc-related predicted phosphoesterase